VSLNLTAGNTLLNSAAELERHSRNPACLCLQRTGDHRSRDGQTTRLWICQYGRPCISTKRPGRHGRVRPLGRQDYRAACWHRRHRTRASQFNWRGILPSGATPTADAPCPTLLPSPRWIRTSPRRICTSATTCCIPTLPTSPLPAWTTPSSSAFHGLCTTTTTARAFPKRFCCPPTAFGRLEWPSTAPTRLAGVTWIVLGNC
jgi:hypothetical protein